jgi:DNA-binding Lrp family transcriptional regulator
MGPQSRRRGLNEELVLMARYLAELGPNINEIARRTGKFKETVRYRYHKFFLEKGITVQAVTSYSKLGFKRLVLIVKLAPACEANAKLIFNAMSDLCYLRSFTRVMLSGEFVVHVAVPSELAEECAAVYTALQEAGLFTELEILEFEEMRNPPMRPDCFDFIRGTWSFDWSSARAKEMKLPLSARPKVEKYDRVDLLILKELDIDASRRLVKMAENVKVNLNALEFHYREHVQARGLIKGYRLVWQGTHYDFEKEKAVSRKDVYLELTLLLKGATQGEVAELMLLLNKTPFLWSEAYDAAYCAEIFLPNYAYIEFLEYVDEFANRVGGKLRIFVMDQGQAIRFVISHSLFDGESKRWKLSEPAVLNALGNMAPLVSGDPEFPGR